MRNNIDIFEMELDAFRWDVHDLVVGTLKAALEHLSHSTDKELQVLAEAIPKETDDDYQQHLVDQHTDAMARHASQVRFLTKMALVALASRLTHALRTMAQQAYFAPRKKRYGTSSDSEFERLWIEYASRFSIDFAINAERIAFTKTLQKVRNQIVHEGGEANTWTAATIDSLQQGEEPLLDTWFSDAYPNFVHGQGWNAEVVVSEKQLNEMLSAATDVVKWLATELSACERAWLATHPRQ